MLHLEKNNPVICNIAVVHHIKSSEYESNTGNFYNEIKSILVNARNKVYTTANVAMVEAYWNIGKKIIDEQGARIPQNTGKG